MHILPEQDQANPLLRFRQAASIRSLVLPEELLADGKIHRCPIVGKADNDGAFLLHSGEIPSGGFQNHADGLGWENWRADIGRPLTPQEQATLQKQIEAARTAQVAEDLRIKAAAASRAKQIWEAATPCDTHPYLDRKGVRSYGLRQKGGDLLVPIQTTKGDLTSIQTITASGSKLFQTGGRKQGCTFILGTVEAGLIYIAEGYATGATIHEATGQAVAVAFDAGNLTPVAKELRALYPDVDLVLCADDDRTEGNPGLTHATAAAQAVNGRFVVPDWGNCRPEGATDFNDMAQHFGHEAVKACIEGQSVTPDPESLADAVKRLANMNLMEYELVRVSEAENFNIRVTALDGFVTAARPSSGDVTSKAVMFPDVEPWPHPVDAAALLDEIQETFHRYIVADPAVGIAISLWIVFTWLIRWLQVAPILILTSPEKRCGKTQTLDFVGRLSCRALVASNISPAAVFRVIEAHTPTLVIDEADTFLKDNEELRGVLNSGHTRQSAYVLRCVGEDQVPFPFSTWAAKAVAGIGFMPGTLRDRSIELTLRRKLPTEKNLRMRHADPDIFTRLTSKLARLAADSGYLIERARPALPDSLNDRAQDNWEPLLAIADLAGGDWPQKARETAAALSGDAGDVTSTAEELLADVMEAFKGKKVKTMNGSDGKEYKAITTEDLLKDLTADDHKPWATYLHGKPINARSLATRLKAFGAKPSNIRLSEKVVRKGYRDIDLQDAFNRYLTPLKGESKTLPATPEHPRGSSGSGKVAVANPDATQERQVADPEATVNASATPGPAPRQAGSEVADPAGVPTDKHPNQGSGDKKGRPF